jgi:hypothetical protein
MKKSEEVFRGSGIFLAWLNFDGTQVKTRKTADGIVALQKPLVGNLKMFRRDAEYGPRDADAPPNKAFDSYYR